MAVLMLIACARDPGPDKALYEPRDGSFTLAAPRSWRVDEAQGEAHRVSFFGPPGTFTESIAVYRYDGMTAVSYRTSHAGSGAGPLTARPDGRSEFLAKSFSPALHGRPPEELAVRHVLAASETGLWALVHTVPAGRAPSPAFEDLVASFKGKP